MDDFIKQKLKLEEKKAKIVMEKAKMKIKERKARTRHLIEMGGLVVKAKLDDLPSNSLLGGLISLKNELLKYPDIQIQWSKIGANIFNQESRNRT